MQCFDRWISHAYFIWIVFSYSANFATIRTIRTIRYSLFATIRCSLFATIRYSLFGFSRHPAAADARRNNCSSIQIQFSIFHFHPQALSSLFGTFHWKIAFFMSYNAAGFLWTRILYLPLDPGFEGIVLLSKATQNWKLCWNPVSVLQLSSR